MDLQRFRELYANNSGVVECVAHNTLLNGFGADIAQSQSTEFLHNVALTVNPADQFLYVSRRNEVWA